jgi:hypothetical protein
VTRAAILTLLVVGASAPAVGQEASPIVRERMTVAPGQPDRRGDQVRVQVGVNFFVPGPTNESEEAAKIRDRARRAVYEMAGRECALLQDTIAAECRLESVNVSINRQSGQVEGFTVSGQLGFRITRK